jgi:hypothetical protein
MARLDKKSIPSGDLAALQLLARGDCYNPQCKERLITQRAGRHIVNFQIAHIRDELPPSDVNADIGWRYWPEEDMNQEQRNHFCNLLLLCVPCHKLIDKLNPRAYPIELLHAWKLENESVRSNELASLLGVVDDTDLLEVKLVDSYVAELYTALDEQTEQLTAVITGGDSFPLAEYPSCDPRCFNSVSPSFTAVGERPVRNVGIEVEIHTSAGMRRGYNDDQHFPSLHAGRSVRVWDEPTLARQIPVDWDDLHRVITKFWADNGYFEQETLFNTLFVNDAPNIFPTTTMVFRVDGSSRILLYCREIIQLADGRICITSQPIISQSM